MIEKVKEIAIEAGNIIMKYHGQKIDFKSKSEERFDPVTAADLEADKYIANKLTELYPNIPILSEENITDSIDYSKRLWVIDPIDGTKEFLRGGPEFAVMIALLDNALPVLGVVYLPYYKELYFAEKGKGSFLQKGNEIKKLQVSDISSIENSRNIVRAPYNFKNMLDIYVENLKVKENIPISCIGVRLCKVAEGKADFSITTVIKAAKWDTAAPQIILEEAGGIMTDFYNNPLDYSQSSLTWEKSSIASNKILHNILVKLIPANAIEMTKNLQKVNK